MREELIQALAEIDGTIEEHAAVTAVIADIKSDRQKYLEKVNHIEAMDYADLDNDVVANLSLLRTRLDLIPGMLERVEGRLKMQDSNLPGSIKRCSRIIEPIVGKYADEKVEAMVEALMKVGTPEEEARQSVGESNYISQIRGLWFRGQGLSVVLDNYQTGLCVLSQLRPVAEEALKESPDFDQFVNS